MIPIHKLIYQLQSKAVISLTIWPVEKHNREWGLTVNYGGLYEVTLWLSAAVLDMLELPI